MKAQNFDQFYDEMFQRNLPLIDIQTQNKIKNLKIAVAGCGSTGGAFLDGAIRLGVINFKIADQGVYEINNLNRQMVDANAMNRNKALAYKDKLISINPHCQIKSYTEGLTHQNLDDFLADVDLVFDAIDVTTAHGMEMKLALHKKAAKLKLAVASALDLAFCQWLQSFDYRKLKSPLKGKLAKAQKCKHPLKSLFIAFCPVEDLPIEILDEAERLLQDPNGSSPSQLGTACFLLSSLVTPYILYFIKHNGLPPLIRLDLMGFFIGESEKKKRDKILKKKRQTLIKMIERLP